MAGRPPCPFHWRCNRRILNRATLLFAEPPLPDGRGSERAANRAATVRERLAKSFMTPCLVQFAMEAHADE